MTQLPLPIPSFSFENEEFTRNCSFSLMTVKARELCLRKNDDDFHDNAWITQRVPCLGPGWDYCPLCRYVVRKKDGCRWCATAQTQKPDYPSVPATISAEELRPYIGRYVAIRDGKVIGSANDIAGVITSLRGRGITAHSMFRVPEDPDWGCDR